MGGGGRVCEIQIPDAAAIRRQCKLKFLSGNVGP